jgi:hypothetical protein
MIRFCCQACGATLKAPDGTEGRISKCKCGAKVVVPGGIIPVAKLISEGPRRTEPCPDCGNQVSKLARSCPACGRPFQEELAAEDPWPAESEVLEQRRATSRLPTAPSSGPLKALGGCLWGCLVLVGTPIGLFFCCGFAGFLDPPKLPKPAGVLQPVAAEPVAPAPVAGIAKERSFGQSPSTTDDDNRAINTVQQALKGFKDHATELARRFRAPDSDVADQARITYYNGNLKRHVTSELELREWIYNAEGICIHFLPYREANALDWLITGAFDLKTNRYVDWRELNSRLAKK